jgi:hypothetical protein
MTDRRRPRAFEGNPHHLAVHLVTDPRTDLPLAPQYLPKVLQVRCACGVIVGGKRFADRTAISLGDLLELVRLHSTGNQP